jgi:hypothetical protein
VGYDPRPLFLIALTGLSTVAAAEQLISGSTETVGFVGGAAGNGVIGAGFAKAINSRWLAIGELGYVHSNALEFGVNGHFLVGIGVLRRRRPK